MKRDYKVGDEVMFSTAQYGTCVTVVTGVINNSESDLICTVWLDKYESHYPVFADEIRPLTKLEKALK